MARDALGGKYVNADTAVAVMKAARVIVLWPMSIGPGKGVMGLICVKLNVKRLDLSHEVLSQRTT